MTSSILFASLAILSKMLLSLEPSALALVVVVANPSSFRRRRLCRRELFLRDDVLDAVIPHEKTFVVESIVVIVSRAFRRRVTRRVSLSRWRPFPDQRLYLCFTFCARCSDGMTTCLPFYPNFLHRKHIAVIP
jgi:hypothetical protein